MPRFAGSLDANIILRLLLNDIPTQHNAALQLLTKHSAQFAVADIAIMEIAFVLKRNYGFTRVQVREALDGFMAIPQINCNRTMITRALEYYEQHPSLSFEDCCLAMYAQLNEAEPLWTFDKKLANQTAGTKLVSV